MVTGACRLTIRVSWHDGGWTVRCVPGLTAMAGKTTLIAPLGR